MIKRWGLIFIVILLTLGVLGFKNEEEASSSVSSDYIRDAEKQLDAVLAAGNSITREPLNIIIKWQGVWNTAYEPKEGAKLIAAELKLAKPSAARVQDHLVYRSAGQVGRVPVKFSVTNREEGLYVVAQIEGIYQGDTAELKQAQTDVGRKLGGLGVDIQWNAAAQGNAKALGAGTAGHQDKDVMKLLGEAESKAGAFFKLHRVEGFQDQYTASESYEVPSFPISVRSGNTEIGLQMAIHLNTGTGVNELSIGSPVLTVEY
ncbi:hypothetical protein EJP77_15100 [Paenibacillus zeisoli]|uniref:TATA-box binding protein n=1 Tax=Paenibacillus zeisoli TaxID=2496267 RepID=A0A3S1DVH4_9BACL|nr:hypothetical protein [Paenibacillus zeisoli]RUT29053.1 hypothetical protein EJP77_15100 [Paenibacillus zeisoli]